MSDRYGKIVVSGCGRYEEGLISGTPKPGTCLTTKAATEPVGGRFTWEVFNRGADGANGAWGVLLEDDLQGYGVGQAYVTGTRGKIYFPCKGDLLQMLVKNIAGTGDTFAIGDVMIIDEDTGKLIDTTGSPEEEAFEICETVAAITADTIVLCRYVG